MKPANLLISLVLTVILAACNDQVFVPDYEEQLPDPEATVVAPGDSIFIPMPTSGAIETLISDVGPGMASFIRTNNDGTIDTISSFESDGVCSKIPFNLIIDRDVYDFSNSPSWSESRSWNLDLAVRAEKKGTWVKVRESLSPYPIEAYISYIYNFGQIDIPLTIKPSSYYQVFSMAYPNGASVSTGFHVEEEAFRISNTGDSPTTILVNPYRNIRPRIEVNPDPDNTRLPLDSVNAPTVTIPLPVLASTIYDPLRIDLVSNVFRYTPGVSHLTDMPVPEVNHRVTVPAQSTVRVTVEVWMAQCVADYTATARPADGYGNQYRIHGYLYVYNPVHYSINITDE